MGVNDNAAPASNYFKDDTNPPAQHMGFPKRLAINEWWIAKTSYGRRTTASVTGGR